MCIRKDTIHILCANGVELCAFVCACEWGKLGRKTVHGRTQVFVYMCVKEKDV